MSRWPTQQVRGGGQDTAECRLPEAPAGGGGTGDFAEEGARLALPGEAPGQTFFPFWTLDAGVELRAAARDLSLWFHQGPSGSSFKGLGGC